MPDWLHDLCLASLLLGALCALIIAADLVRRPQSMWIMNLVWPVTALFGSAWILWQYFAYGRSPGNVSADAATARNTAMPEARQPPFWVAAANAALHCGSGCTLGDIAAEWLVFLVPSVAGWFGWRRLFGDKIFAAWTVDYLFAYGFGIVFQYFTIAPMRGLGFADGMVAAAKADTLSLTAWQVGMYGFMAFADFYLFRRLLGAGLATNSMEF